MLKWAKMEDSFDAFGYSFLFLPVEVVFASVTTKESCWRAGGEDLDWGTQIFRRRRPV